MKCDMDDKIKKELTGKVYGDYNALAINMGVKQPFLDDHFEGFKPDVNVKQFFVIDYFECLKPDETIKRKQVIKLWTELQEQIKMINDGGILKNEYQEQNRLSSENEYK